MDLAQTKSRNGIKALALNGRLAKYALPSLLLTYMVLAFTLPGVRDFYYWQIASGRTVIRFLFEAMFGMTLYALIFAVVMVVEPKTQPVLDRICGKKVIIGGGLSLLSVCLILTGLHVPGWWWTWLTVGVQVVTIMLVYLMLEHRIGYTKALIMGIALSGLAIGVWEIPYQIGLKLVYESNLPSSIMFHNMAREVMIEFAFIIPAVIVLMLYNSKYGIVNFSRWFWLFLGLTVGLYVYWFASGFWVEMTYDWANYQWVQHPVDVVAKTVYRASKVTLALAMVSLVWKNWNWRVGQ